MADIYKVGEDVSHRWELFEKNQEIVDTKFTEGREIAQAAYNQAQEAIDKLVELASQLNSVETDIPLPADLTIPELDEFVGEPPGAAPDIILALPTDLTEADSLNLAIKEKILHDINEFSPAVSDEVQDAIFNKDNERALLILADELDRVSSEWSKRSMPLPDGFLANQLTQVQIEYSNKRLDASRDIAIKTFELSDSNMKFMIQQGLAWLSQKIEIYKAKVNAEIARIDAIVRGYVAEAQVYLATAQVYTSLIDAKVKKFSAEVSMAVAKSELLIKSAELDMKNFEVLNGLKIEAMKGIAAVSAQVAAGAFSSVSAGVSLSADNRASYNYSVSDQSED